MKLQSVHPMLAATDIDETIRFYRDLLGFECVNRRDGWAALQKDNVEMMISLPNVHEPFERPILTGSIYFNTTDVNALWGQIKDRANVVYPVENFDYGMREFAIRDNNGYILQFGQEITDLPPIPSRGMD